MFHCPKFQVVQHISLKMWGLYLVLLALVVIVVLAFLAN